MQLYEAAKVGVGAGNGKAVDPAFLGTDIGRRIANGKETDVLIIALAHAELEGDWIALVIEAAAAIDVAGQRDGGTVNLRARESVGGESSTCGQYRAVGQERFRMIES